ncbi:terminase small subunit, partial [Pedobacter sp. MC2016-24]|uniref:terminase small subunit n=1 Tax=Pedobacter sp. MC2016-24 TaxID=2780090 RepID=UPI0019F793B3
KDIVLDHLDEIFNDVEGNKIVYLGIALANLGLYNSIWTDWIAKFDGDKIVSQAIKRIEAKIEANLLSQALTNQVNSAIAIFVLKNKYKWSDRQEIDHTTQGDKITWNEVKTYRKDSE